MTPDTPEFSCESRGCRCYGTDRRRFDTDVNRCRDCGHTIDKHAPYPSVGITAKLFLTGKTIDDAICLQCGDEIAVAPRITAGATGQQVYAYGAVLSHLRAHGIDTPLSPVMLAEPLKPVAYFVFQPGAQ
jgi:hypothetical protein